MRWRRDRGAQQHAASASLGEIEGFHWAPDIDESAAKTRSAAAGSPASDTHSLHRIVGQGGTSHRLIRAARSCIGQRRARGYGLVAGSHNVRTFAQGIVFVAAMASPRNRARRPLSQGAPRGVSVWRLLRQASRGILAVF
ncbi:hypothetical protein MRX96_005245 [Rhipicephalus microplus]